MEETDNVKFISVVICADYAGVLEELLTNIFVSGCVANNFSIKSIDTTGLPQSSIGCYITQNV